MNLRLALYELAARHRLEGRAVVKLARLAALDAEPPGAAAWLVRAAGSIGALLAGLGVVFWIAANWHGLGRFGKFALLQGLVVILCLGAWARPGMRAPLALLALLGIGALFAYFGQTYQTGADAWQLFALWALLGLPLAFAARSEIVWVPWAIVAVSAISLWTHAHTAHRWRFEAQDLQVHALGWAEALALVAALGPAARRWTGAGAWSYRSALLLAVVVVGGSALGALFDRRLAPQYPLGLVVLGAGFAALATRRGFDLFGLSVLALAIDTLLVAGLAHWLFLRRSGGDPIGQLLLLGLAAAGLLAASVGAVMRIARARGQEAQP